MRFAIMTALALALTGAGAHATLPLEAFGRLPSVDQIVVSPDGTMLASVVGDGPERDVQIRRTSDRTLLRRIGVDAVKVRDIRWAGNAHLIISASTTRAHTDTPFEELRVIDYNVVTSQVVRPLQVNVPGVRLRLTTAAAIPVTRVVDGVPLVFNVTISFPGSGVAATLVRTDLTMGRSREVELGNRETIGWSIDAHGTAVARADYDQKTGRWTLFTRAGGDWVRSLGDTFPIDLPDVGGTGIDPGTLLVALPDSDEPRFRTLKLGGTELSAPVPELAGGRPIRDPATGTIIGVAADRGQHVDLRFFAPGDAKLWTQVQKSFPRAAVDLVSWSDDRQKVVLRVFGKNHGAAFYLLDVASKHADWLADAYTGVGAGDVAAQSPMTYPALDGTPIPAFVTLPPGRPPSKLPLIVLPHGGPGAHDEAGFDWFAQALASRGYAVLQPQYRGSTGFGETFHAAGYGEWGRKMQTDLSDGVGYLAAAGTIDPARVCIAGTSYGGYAALAGVALQHGIYRCAVSVAGPADLRQVITGGHPNLAAGIGVRFWERYIGAKSLSDPLLADLSPARQAAKITVPVLLIHGDGDSVVPISQSRTMASALTRAGHPTGVVVLKGEDHWLSRGETRTAMLTATAAFLASANPAD